MKKELLNMSITQTVDLNVFVNICNYSNVFAFGLVGSILFYLQLAENLVEESVLWSSVRLVCAWSVSKAICKFHICDFEPC